MINYHGPLGSLTIENGKVLGADAEFADVANAMVDTFLGEQYAPTEDERIAIGLVEEFGGLYEVIDAPTYVKGRVY